ncbi:MAG: hypothetical protein HY317_03205 [Acidobacteria bacterium]|nr:hypothetical protein [Acidobacteriota bacterium]
MTFVKLDTNILDSSLWVEPADVRIAFITILAMAGPDGVCPATAPGIARRANLPLDVVERALAVLEAPDPHSRSLAEGGRRVRRVDGGYLAVNYLKYRQRDHTVTERKRRQRERDRQAIVETAYAETAGIVDAYNQVFGTRLSHTAGNLKAARRALDGGYTLGQMRAVFEAVKARSTETARWCAEHNRAFEYLIRPTYRHRQSGEMVQGPLDKITNELGVARPEAPDDPHLEAALDALDQSTAMPNPRKRSA